MQESLLQIETYHRKSKLVSNVMKYPQNKIKKNNQQFKNKFTATPS